MELSDVLECIFKRHLSKKDTANELSTKYGVTNYSSTSECREKVRSTCQEQFGTATPAQNNVVLEKMKATCIEKFGVGSKKYIYTK